MKKRKNLVMKLEILKKDDSFYFFSNGFYLEGDLRMKKIIGDAVNNFQEASKTILSILDFYKDNRCKFNPKGFKGDFLEKNIFSTYVEKHNRLMKI